MMAGMLLELPAILLLVSAPVWAVAAHRNARRLGEEERGEARRRARARALADAVAVALSWAFEVEVEVERSWAAGERLSLFRVRGSADGQRFVVALEGLEGEGALRWSAVVQLQPVLDAGVELRWRSGLVEGGLGHPGFDARWRVEPRGAAVAPGLVECLGEHELSAPLESMALVAGELRAELPVGPTAWGMDASELGGAEQAAGILAALRELLDLARSLEDRGGSRVLR